MNINHFNKIQIITIASDIGAGTQGSAEGAKYLTNLFSSAKLSNLDNILLQGPEKNYSPYANAKHIEKFTPFAQNIICPTLYSCCQKGYFPLILSGDHANSIGIIAGIQKANPKAKVGILWIDAHSDIHTPYTTPSGNLHGMSLAALTRIDNCEKAIWPQQSNIADFWNTLKFLATEHSGLSFNQIGFIGLRSFEEAEISLIQKEKIQVWTVEKLRSIGILQLTQEVEKYFSCVDHLIISFDVDVLDNSYFQATGTPEPDGLAINEAKELLTQLLRLPKLMAFEVTEFNPSLSPNTSHWVDELSHSIKEALIKRIHHS